MLVVSVISTIFGVLTARRITQRLQRMTEAAHAWSVGDFQANVSDHSSDELGQLAQDLNRMALQVQNLLDARQQLASLEERQRVARDLQRFGETAGIRADPPHRCGPITPPR